MNETTGTELLTERLRMRAPTEADADFVLDMYSRPEVTRHIGTHDWVETSRDQSLHRIERYRAQFGAASGVWLCEKREDGAQAGFALLKPIPFSDHVEAAPQDTEIGWHLHPDTWGSGLATEAAQALVSHARTQGLERLVAVTHADNAASQAVARRLGMSHQGPTDRYYDTTCELFTLRLR